MGYQIDLDGRHQRKDYSSLFIKSLGSLESAGLGRGAGGGGPWVARRKNNNQFTGELTLKYCVGLGGTYLRGRPPAPQIMQFLSI